MSLKIKLIPGNIVIKQIEPETEKGGLYIPENAQVKKNEGIVMAVSPRTDGNELTVTVGDKVLFRQHSGTSFELDGKKYLMMSEEHIFGVI